MLKTRFIAEPGPILLEHLGINSSKTSAHICGTTKNAEFVFWMVAVNWFAELKILCTVLYTGKKYFLTPTTQFLSTEVRKTRRRDDR
jgi:hypothetical protein